MRVLRALLILALAALIGACATARVEKPPLRILFVGNSLTYVGNLPAVFEALARRSGRPVRSDMLVKGGATLSQRLADGSVELALATVHYDHVVLQERGGDFLCAFGPDSCERATASLRRIATMAIKQHAMPLLLGTYQGLPKASRTLVDAEAIAAANIGIPHVALSNHFQAAIHEVPSGEWLFADGMHPGHQLVLLEAILLYEALFNDSPIQGALAVSAPMHAPDARFPVAVVDSTFSPGPAANVAGTYSYPANVVARTLTIANNAAP